jgi:uncharacterized protein YbjT (DUF2867 family)
MLFLTGATGSIGSHVAAQLRGHNDVRVLAHSERSAAQLADSGLDVVRGDLGRPATLDGLLAGVTRLFVLSPDSDDQAEREAGVIAAAEAQGQLEHVVKVSTIGAGAPEVISFLQPHAEVEQRLTGQSYGASFVRPDFLMTNLLGDVDSLRAGRIALPAGDARLAFVDPRDVADVAVRCLTADRPPSGPINVTGPELLTFTEVAEMLSDEIGTTVTFHSPPIDEWRAGALAHGIPERRVDGLLDLFTQLRGPFNPGIHDDQVTLLGRPARSLRTWIADGGLAAVTS